MMQHMYICFDADRVFFKIFWIVKLGRVHKNAANGEIDH